MLLAYGHKLYYLDSYRADYRASDEIGPVFQMATVWSWLTVLALHLVGSATVPIDSLALFWVLTVLLLTGLRSVVRSIARRQPWYLQDALLIGPPDQTDVIVRKIDRHPEWGIRAKAYVDLSREEANEIDMISLVRHLRVDRVMLTPAFSESRDRTAVVCELGDLGVHVDLIPSWSDTVGARMQLNEMEGMPLLTVPRNAMGRTAVRLKRTLDLVAGTLAVILLSPVLGACALAIKLDPGAPSCSGSGGSGATTSPSRS